MAEGHRACGAAQRVLDGGEHDATLGAAASQPTHEIHKARSSELMTVQQVTLGSAVLQDTEIYR
jgi:hypothetical protein